MSSQHRWRGAIAKRATSTYDDASEATRLVSVGRAQSSYRLFARVSREESVLTHPQSPLARRRYICKDRGVGTSLANRVPDQTSATTKVERGSHRATKRCSRSGFAPFRAFERSSTGQIESWAGGDDVIGRILHCGISLRSSVGHLSWAAGQREASRALSSPKKVGRFQSKRVPHSL